MNCILCVSENWGIGKDNQLLFHLPPDMAFFRETTKNHVVIMGHSTLKSFPGGKPLPKRVNIVLSRQNLSPEGFILCHSLNDVFAYIQSQKIPSEDIYIIGGENIYRQFLPYCQTAYITKVNQPADADRFFPNLDEDDNWTLQSCSEEQIHGNLSFRFCTYQNKKPLVF